MELRVEIKKLKEVMAAIETAPVTMKREMRLALKESLIAVKRRARLEHNFRTRTGALEKSINYEITSEWPPVGRVWLDNSAGVVYKGWRLTADTSYGVFLHEGTRSHWVEPKKYKALRWTGPDGKYWFSKGHNVSGIKKDQFIYKAGENEKDNINDIFDRHINKALEQLSRWKGRV